MRNKCCGKRRGSLIAWAAVAVGTIILLILILPVWVWWFLCGTALMTGGILLLRR